MEQNSRSIDNYSMAVTAVNKVYQSPKKPVSVKKVLMIVLPVLFGDYRRRDPVSAVPQYSEQNAVPVAVYGKR